MEGKDTRAKLAGIGRNGILCNVAVHSFSIFNEGLRVIEMLSNPALETKTSPLPSSGYRNTAEHLSK